MKTHLTYALFIFFIFFTSLLNAHNLQKVSLQLSWKHQFEFAGFYAAKEKGFYKESGLDVQIKEINIQAKESVIDDVVKGKSTYAISYSSIVKGYLEGKPLVFVANFLKHSPLVLATQKDIEMPNDLIGKKFMGGNDALKNTSIRMMLDKFGIDEKTFTNVPQTFSIKEFINKEVDVLPIFLTNQAHKLDKMGYEYNILNPEKYGAEFYVDNLFTSKNELTKYPKRVKAFKEASIKGWKYALENQEEIIDLILKKYNTQKKTKKELSYEAKQIERLVLRSIYPLGSIDIKRVQRTIDSYIELDGVGNKKSINIDDFVYENKYSFVSLSPKEQEYLKKKKIIKFCVDPDWMPFEKIDEKGNHIGLSSDYFEIFKQKISIPMMLIKTNSWSESLEFVKTHRCDMLALAARISSREEYLSFTQPYINVPLVLATKPNISFIDDMLRINNVKVGVTKGYIFKELLEKKYTNFDIIEVENSSDGLHKVVNGELFGYIDTLATIAYKLQNGLMGELKIAAKFDEKLKLSIALRGDEPLLLSVFEKMLATIDNNKRQDIFNKYVAIVYEKKANYILWIKSMLVALFIIVLIVYWNRRLHKEKANTETALEELKHVEKILEQKNKELEQISITDKLTGVYNRTKTDRTLQEELDRSARTHEPFSIIMLDIDLFKCINDTYGHQTGDMVLVTIANILKKSIRKTDVLGRWGGEEFLIICPHTNLHGASKKAESMRKMIFDCCFDDIGKQTASFGVTCYQKGDTPHIIINRADKAMYRAKHQGRNTVIAD